jgi:hypothetical protein
MVIDESVAGLVLAMLVQAIGSVWWAASLTNEVQALKKWRDEHDDVRERIVRVEERMTDVRESLRRIESRLHITPAE